MVSAKQSFLKLFRTPSVANTQRSRSKGPKRSLEEHAGYATEEKVSSGDDRFVKEAADPPPAARQEHRSLADRQAEEKEFIRKNDTAEAHVWYLIDVKWLTQWKHFVTGKGPLPGRIDNSRLCDDSGTPRAGLRLVDDYRGVNQVIWEFWYFHYGGGPMLKRKTLDLYSAPAEEDERWHVDKSNHSAASEASSSTSASSSNRVEQSRRNSQQQPQQQQQRGRRPASAPREEPAKQRVSTSRQEDVRKVPEQEEPPSPARSRDSRIAEQETRAERNETRAADTEAPQRSRTQDRSQMQQRSRSSNFFSRAGSTSSATSSAAARGRSSVSARTRDDEDGAPAAAAPKCDRCDGPHETDRCPHFKKPRDKHADAWSNYGKASAIRSAETNVVVVKNARVVPQPGDGSCLFHSLSYGLGSSNAAALRREISNYISKNPDTTIADTSFRDWVQYDSGHNTCQSYASKMQTGGWGGGIEMAALTKMKNVNVHVYERCSHGFKRISCFEADRRSNGKTINVLYQGRMHYDALVI